MKQIPHPVFEVNKKSRLFGTTEPNIETLESISILDSDSGDDPIGRLIAENTGPNSKKNEETAELIKSIRIPLGWRIADPPAGSLELIKALPSGTRWNIICRLIEMQTIVIKSILSSEPLRETSKAAEDGRNSLKRSYLERLAAATDLLDSLTDLLALQEHAVELRRRLAEQTPEKSKRSGRAKTAG